MNSIQPTSIAQLATPAHQIAPSHGIARRLLLSAAVGASLMGLMPASQAQSFPSKTVKIIVPYAPGGGLDVMARLLAERLQRKWNQPVVVENKTGASTIIGTQAVTKAAPDGHTLLLTSEATITSNPYLFDKLPYDPARDLAPISQILSLPQMVVAHPSITANTLSELVAQAKSGKQAINYASYGSGSLPHLLFGGLKVRSGLDLVQVPYKGISPAVLATLGNEVQLTLAGASAAQAHIQAGKLKPLAVGAPQRLESLPEVPTLAELGFPEANSTSLFGIFAPANVPAAVLQRLNQEFNKALASPDIQAKLKTSDNVPTGGDAKSFARQIAQESANNARIVKAANLHAK